MSLNFCCDNWILGSEFGVNSMTARIHLASYQLLRLVGGWGVMVWDVFS